MYLHKCLSFTKRNFLQISIDQGEQETIVVDDEECMALMENVGATAAEPDNIETDVQELNEHAKMKVIKMLRDDGTIYEMEDNIVLPDNMEDDSTDEEDELI